MADRPTLIRQWLLLRMLCASRFGCRLRDLSREFTVSEKSIRRDLDALTEAGFHLEELTEEHGRKRWRLKPDQLVPVPALNVAEAAALYLGRRLLEPLAGTALWESAQSAFVKLRQQFCPEARDYLEKLGSTLHETSFGDSDYSERADVIDTLMTGVNQCRVARLLYHPLRSEIPEPYELHPLGLIWHRRTLYLVAASAARPEPRHFKVDRLRDVKLLEETFDRPTAFDLERHLAHSLGIYHSTGPVTEICVRFSAEVARYVTEHRWHHSQQIDPQNDGSLLLRLQLGDLHELRSWVLSFGPQAEVLSPESLRHAIREELKSALAAYDAPGTASTPAQPARKSP